VLHIGHSVVEHRTFVTQPPPLTDEEWRPTASSTHILHTNPRSAGWTLSHRTLLKPEQKDTENFGKSGRVGWGSGCNVGWRRSLGADCSSSECSVWGRGHRYRPHSSMPGLQSSLHDC
jgi:hypothetical protein